MAKKDVHCPECGHKFKVQFQGVTGQTAGVRFRETTKKQFRQTIDVPGEMIEHDRYYTMGDQLLAAAAIGISGGALSGYIISSPWHATDPGLSAEIIIGGILTGLTFTWTALAKERLWQWKEAIPGAVNGYLELAKGTRTINEGPTLTVDHRYRDGKTEAGRTIQYFGQLPVDVERFNEWARDVLGGDSLAIANWTGSNKPFSRQEYEALLSIMHRAGAVINQPGKGNLLTGHGRRALTNHLKQEARYDSNGS